MNYASSPSATLVATVCAACSLPLCDALSVETGLGPVCREKHGYDRADAPPDWTQVQGYLGRHLTVLALPVGWDQDVRKLANVLVHRIAVEQSGVLAIDCCDALRALGFRRLGDRVAMRMAKIRIRVDEAKKEIVIKAPYTDELRSVPGRRWDADEGVSRITVRVSMQGAKRMVLDALSRAFPGALVDGPKGLFVLED